MSTPIILKEGMVLIGQGGETWEVGRAEGKLAWFRPLRQGGIPVQIISRNRSMTLLEGQSISYNPIIGWNIFYKQITK